MNNLTVLRSLEYDNFTIMKSKSMRKKTGSARAATRAASNRQTSKPSPEFQMKRILVTTDFSDESRKALPFAAAFAERFSGEIALLHVIEPPPRFADVASVVGLLSGDDAMGRVYGGLDKLATQVFKSKSRVTTHAPTGKPFREIIKAARELDAGLVIMATHGYSGLKHTFLGSTTERVIQHAPCPVLAVRGVEGKSSGGRKTTVPIKRIVLATDFSDNSMKTFPLARALAVSFGARLTLLNVVEQFPIDALLGQELTRETSEPLMAQARLELTKLAAGLRKRGGPQADIEVRFGKPFDEITRAAESLNASLIVVATHGYTGLKHLYLGSVAERVVRHAHCPVLVVRQPKR